MVSQFSHMHLIFSEKITLDYIGVFLSYSLLQESHYFRLFWLISGFCNMDGLHNTALLHDHLTKIKHGGMKIIAILVGSCLQLSTSNFLEKEADFSAIVILL